MSPADLVDHALDLATGALIVQLVERTEANLRWANSALTTNGEMHTRTLTVYATAEVEGGTALGTVSQQISGPEEIAAVVRAAEQAAREGLASLEAAALVDAATSDPGWRDDPDTTDIEVLAGVARGLGAAFAQARLTGHLLFGFAEHVLTTTYLGSSTGLRRRGVQPSGRIELNTKTADLAASTWAGRATRDFRDVDVADLYQRATTELGWAATRIDLPPGRYETLLPPGAVADLLVYLVWTANARDAEEGRNVFSAPGGTRIGERLSHQPITVSSDPSYPGVEAVPFVDYAFSMDGSPFGFDQGLPIPATEWISDGVLNELVRNRAQGARTGRAATPPADNLIMTAGGTATLPEMIARTRRGLLLTCLWYIREVDPERLLLTGLTRDGVYLVEDGRVVGAVNNFRWNESPVELLGRMTEIGISEPTLCREWNDYVNRTVMPPVRIADFNMSTVSQAS
jgi:predicted Zn-dependent protease